MLKWKINKYLEHNSKNYAAVIEAKYHKARLEHLTTKQLLGNENDNYILCNQVADSATECDKIYNEWQMSKVWQFYLTQAAINFEPVAKQR